MPVGALLGQKEGLGGSNFSVRAFEGCIGGFRNVALLFIHLFLVGIPKLSEEFTSWPQVGFKRETEING